MATAFNTRKRIRRFFGHIESVAPMPNLIEVQKSSYEGFLQRNVAPAKRTQSGLLKPGEELRLDTVRFLLITPGMDARQQSAGPRSEPEAKAAKGGSNGAMIAIGVVVAAVVLGAILHFAGVF